MTSALVIANPSASQFTGGLHRTTMRLLGRHFDTTPIWPQSPEHSRLAARDAAASGVDLVVAMGGDGIVHHVAQGLVGSRTVLGIIPSGTTNVVARLLGIPGRPSAATKLLADGHDVFASPTLEVAANGPAGAWTARAVFSLGIGPDAVVVAAAETEPYRKYRFGGVHYARTAFGVIWSDIRRRKPSLTLSFAGDRPVIGAMVQFHDQYTYFGRIPLHIDDLPPDPMSVLAIEHLPARRAGSIVRRAATGSLGDVRGLHLERNVADFRLEGDLPVDVQLDGEHYGQVSTLHVTADPASLRIAVPPSSDGPTLSRPDRP